MIDLQRFCGRIWIFIAADALKWRIIFEMCVVDKHWYSGVHIKNGPTCGFLSFDWTHFFLLQNCNVNAIELTIKLLVGCPPSYNHKVSSTMNPFCWNTGVSPDQIALVSIQTITLSKYENLNDQPQPNTAKWGFFL